MSTLVDAGRGAVLVAALFHAAFNATCLYVGVVGSDHALIWTAGAVTAVLAVVHRGRDPRAAAAPHACLRPARPHPTALASATTHPTTRSS